jgi:hypothetical protein
VHKMSSLQKQMLLGKYPMSSAASRKYVEQEMGILASARQTFLRQAVLARKQ